MSKNPENINRSMAQGLGTTALDDLNAPADSDHQGETNTEGQTLHLFALCQCESCREHSSSSSNHNSVPSTSGPLAARSTGSREWVHGCFH